MIRSEKTRMYIIEKTAAIFNKKGYTGTYLSDLTEATGLTKGSIYGNFKDKNEVALEAFRFNYKLLTEEVNQKMQQIDRADEKLLLFLNHQKTHIKTIFDRGGCAILNTAIDADDSNVILKEEVQKSLKHWITSFASILSKGIDKGELKPIAVEPYVHKIIALIEGSIMLAKTLNNHQILMNNIEVLEEEIKSLRMA